MSRRDFTLPKYLDRDFAIDGVVIPMRIRRLSPAELAELERELGGLCRSVIAKYLAPRQPMDVADLPGHDTPVRVRTGADLVRVYGDEMGNLPLLLRLACFIVLENAAVAGGAARYQPLQRSRS